jgi:hypothetical protein
METVSPESSVSRAARTFTEDVCGRLRMADCFPHGPYDTVLFPEQAMVALEK